MRDCDCGTENVLDHEFHECAICKFEGCEDCVVWVVESEEWRCWGECG